VGRSVNKENDGRSVLEEGRSDWDGSSEYDDGLSDRDGVSVEDGAATGCASQVVGPQTITGAEGGVPGVGAKVGRGSVGPMVLKNKGDGVGSGVTNAGAGDTEGIMSPNSSKPPSPPV